MGFLPAFEAAARLGSFKAAAAELHVTPSAISQQIKALEAALGVSLFRREGRVIVLTLEGADYAREVRHALADLAAAGRRLRRRHATPVLRLSTAPFVAYEFLLPRLSDFRLRFPNLELSLEATMQLVDLAASDIDAALRIGGGPWPGCTTRIVGTSELAIVCTPALARSIHTTRDLRGQTLIDIRGREHRGWRALLADKGIREDQARFLTFETYFETVRAAEQGLGLAWGLFPMTSDWVKAGRLAVPLRLRTMLSGHIALIHRPADAERFPFIEIGRWLAEQYAALAPLPAGRIGGD
jgi:LysR family glycine cleavage system transcriptional activator